MFKQFPYKGFQKNYGIQKRKQSNGISAGTNPNIIITLNCFELCWWNFQLFQTQDCPPKLNFEPIRTSQKSPNFKPVLLKKG